MNSNPENESQRMKRATVICLAIALMLIPLTGVSCGSDGDTATGVNFLDDNLEAAIREAIDKPEGDIEKSDLESLTKLDLSEKGITNLSGLEYCTSLTVISLGGNQISEISHLKSLTSLTLLTLYHNQISDISPLENLTSLLYLDLRDNQIRDIEPLVNNPGLCAGGDGDYVVLTDNPLTCGSINIYIPQLEERGVSVDYN